LCSQYPGDLSNHVDNENIHRIDRLHFDDIVTVVGDKIDEANGFCRGMVDPSDAQVEYRIFKERFSAEVRRISKV